MSKCHLLCFSKYVVLYHRLQSGGFLDGAILEDARLEPATGLANERSHGALVVSRNAIEAGRSSPTSSSESRLPHCRFSACFFFNSVERKDNDEAFEKSNGSLVRPSGSGIDRRRGVGRLEQREYEYIIFAQQQQQSTWP